MRLRESLTSALGPDSHGVDAADNVRQSLSNVNLATSNMAEDTEALKHGFLFRGFFKRRGYYSLANLKADEYRSNRGFAAVTNPRAWLDKPDLFENQPDRSEELSPAGKAKIDEAMAKFGEWGCGTCHHCRGLFHNRRHGSPVRDFSRARDSCPSVPADALWAQFSRRGNRSAPRSTSAKHEQEKLGRCLPRVAQAKGLCTLVFLCTSFCAAAKPALFVECVVKRVSIGARRHNSRGIEVRKMANSTPNQRSLSGRVSPQQRNRSV